MINVAFWKVVKERWIRNEDPTINATKDFIQKDNRKTEDINALNAAINGNLSEISGSLDNLNSMMEQLNELGVDSDPFDDLFQDVGN